MIRIRCDRANAYLQETETLTAGMVNLPTVQFTFSEDWDGYGKTAVVRAGNVRVEVLLIEDAITVPAGCLEVAGVNLIIGVYGADSTHELPTVWCACGEILDGTDINSAINHTEATSSNVDQMLEYAASIEAYAEDLDENVIREVEADDTNANQYGTVGVDITDDHDPDSRKLTFTFTNLKGNGIEALNIIDDEEDPNYGKLQIRQSNGTIQNFSGLKDAIDSIDGLEEDIESAEAARVIAETGRTTAEATRVTNESGRNRAEGVREQNEAARAAAEEDRVELFDHVSEMTADAETLAAGSYATAEKQVDSSGNINFHFGIPKGDKGTKGDKGNKGDKGDKGDTGDTGATPAFSIGTVTTGAPGTNASATITGTDAAPVLNLTIPRGNTGEISQEEYDAISDILGNLFDDTEALAGATGITRASASEYVGTASAFETFILNNYTLDETAEAYVISFDVYTEANSSSSGTGLEVQYGNHSSMSELTSFDNDQTDPYHFESFFSVTYAPTVTDRTLGLKFKANSAPNNIWHVSNIRLVEGMEMPDGVTAKDVVARDEAKEAKDAAVAARANTQAMIAAAYDATKTYAVGDYVTYNDALYCCKTAITTAEAWTASHWEAAKVGPDLKDLKSSLTSGLKKDAIYHLGFYLDENGDLCQVDEEE